MSKTKRYSVLVRMTDTGIRRFNVRANDRTQAKKIAVDTAIEEGVEFSTCPEFEAVGVDEIKEDRVDEIKEGRKRT